MMETGTTLKNSKSARILALIGESDGMTFTEIQRALWEMDGSEPFTRENRGYWCTNLLGGPWYHAGLLNHHCTKGADGKWRLTTAPSAHPWHEVRNARYVYPALKKAA